MCYFTAISMMTLSTAAILLYTSPIWIMLMSLFQAIYGESPARWIREQRLRKAHEMLQSTSLSVTDIAYSLGFENPTHFSRIFKQSYGISPSSVCN
ncbi:MAG: helix-turn-helix transcriptional regulator [Bacteroidales bacterium]|nr:helix-turn-helix transcriptional regulator [Bacteroidales bacterium]